MDNKYTLYGLGCIGLFALAFVWPVVSFVLGAFIGWLASSVFVFLGNWIVSGMALLGVNLTLSSLPLFTATLGFIGGFFKNYNTSRH